MDWGKSSRNYEERPNRFNIFRLTFISRDERQVVSEATYEALADLIRHEHDFDNPADKRLLKTLAALSDRVALASNHIDVSSSELSTLIPALKMYDTGGQAITQRLGVQPDSRTFTGHKAELRQLAGELLVDLGVPRILFNDPAADTFGTGIEDGGLAGR